MLVRLRYLLYKRVHTQTVNVQTYLSPLEDEAVHVFKVLKARVRKFRANFVTHFLCSRYKQIGQIHLDDAPEHTHMALPLLTVIGLSFLTLWLSTH